MEKTKVNQFVLKGEIAEVLKENSIIRARITCKPGTLIIEVPSPDNYQLGDEVLITGKFTCEKIENINNFSTNH